MRFFHTSDWHLGQSLYGQSREYEHAVFLTWLLDQITEQQPDALLIAGCAYAFVFITNHYDCG
jgi:exonuclease SbcD